MSSVARHYNETFEAYKERRKADGKAEERRLLGRVFWDGRSQGTYRHLNKRGRLTKDQRKARRSVRIYKAVTDGRTVLKGANYAGE